MKSVEVFLWDTVSDTVPGKRIKTRYLMSRDEALRRDPSAVPLPGSMQIRQVCETDEEVWRQCTSGQAPRG